MKNAAMSRPFTCGLLKLIDDGVLDPTLLVEMCVNYMSEDEVEEMMRRFSGMVPSINEVIVELEGEWS
jgi:hypothetical protein